MNESILALLGFVSWTVLLVLICVGYRSVLVLIGAKKANEFPAIEPHGPQWYQRLTRAHMNCLENLPLFGSVILIAVTTGNGQITDQYALWYLAARIGQSIIHMISTHHFAVQLRFAFYLVQIGILVWMVVQLMLLFW